MRYCSWFVGGGGKSSIPNSASNAAARLFKAVPESLGLLVPEPSEGDEGDAREDACRLRRPVEPRQHVGRARQENDERREKEEHAEGGEDEGMVRLRPSPEGAELPTDHAQVPEEDEDEGHGGDP